MNIQFLLAVLLVHQLHAFSTSQSIQRCQPSPLHAKRYGPPSEEINLNETNDTNDIKSQFISLLNDVMSSTEEEIPGLLTRNMNTIMTALSIRDFLDDILQDETSNTSSTYHLEQVSDAINTILIFVESFVEETSQMETTYKRLLGKIFKLITPAKNNQMESESVTELHSNALENELDKVLAQEKEAFTPGFLRHLEGECMRIESSKSVTPESTKMLQILRVIQTRVLEELGKVRAVFCSLCCCVL
jgi:aspartate aminotransferase-like enzyme